MSKEWRVGSGYHWKSDEDSGYSVDDLDTKQLSDLGPRADLFARLFILTREALESYKELDRGFEGDSLDICHHISRYMSQNKKCLRD